MKVLRTLWYLLGSVYFALFLIACTALFVIGGTIIESKTQSHLYAAHFTFGNPIFAALLWGYFVNILVSALRRWPFKLYHIPFLITHLGLLMLLGGVLIKNYFGVQGSMGIMEGASGNQIFLPETYTIKIEKRTEQGTVLESVYELDRKTLALRANKPFSELKVKVSSFAPHSQTKLETWIKRDHAIIAGIKPVPVVEWWNSQDSLSNAATIEADLHHNNHPWQILAYRTPYVKELAERVYREDTKLHIHDTTTNQMIYQGPILPDIGILNWDFSPIHGFGEPALLIAVDRDKILIPLNGNKSLQMLNQTPPYLGSGRYTIDIFNKPTLLFIEDLSGDQYLFAFDRYGQVYADSFRQDNLNSLIVYDQGYGGYAIQAIIPFESYPSARADRYHAKCQALALNLRQAAQELSELTPPLQLLRSACKTKQLDFAEVTLSFLERLDQSNSWLLPSDFSLPDNVAHAIDGIDWNLIPEVELAGCYWSQVIFAGIEPQLRSGKDLIDCLKEKKWPLVSQLEQLQVGSGFGGPKELQLLLQGLQQQIFSTFSQHYHQLPLKVNIKREDNPTLLSALFRAYGIDLKQLFQETSTSEMQELLKNYALANKYPESLQDQIHLETPFTFAYHTLPLSSKLEENQPLLSLELIKDSKRDRISLAYDRYGTGFKWPILQGEYVVRFQPRFHTIPYTVRLRDARQINYANAAQPYSYESDLIITDSQNHQQETTISMNNVHETVDGYRFYLANITPSEETAAQQAQIVVNYDPAKYWLTYPGALMLSLGIILLFWVKKFKK